MKASIALRENYALQVAKLKEVDPMRYWGLADYLPAESVFQFESTGAHVALRLRRDDNSGRYYAEVLGFFVLPNAVKGAGLELLKNALVSFSRVYFPNEPFEVRLDCFSPVSGFYKSHGFEVSHRMMFNAEYAPKGWDKAMHGEPELVFMTGKFSPVHKSFMVRVKNSINWEA